MEKSDSSDSDNYFDTLEISSMDKVSCIKCNLEVTDRHTGAIECDICMKYLHKNCFGTKREYDSAVKEEFWICSDDCWNVLPVDKNVFHKGKEINDEGMKAVYDMMKGVVLSGARQSIRHTENYHKLSNRVNVIESNVEDINQKIESDLCKTNAEIKKVDERAKKEIKDLKLQIDQLTNERNSRTLVVLGLNFAKIGNVTQLVQKYFTEINIDIQPLKCFAIRSKNPSQSSTNNANYDPIIIEFPSLIDKEKFAKSVKQFRLSDSGTNIYIREYLSSKNQELLAETKVALKIYYEYIWCRMGRIYVKRDSNVTGCDNENPIYIKDSNSIKSCLEKRIKEVDHLFTKTKNELGEIFQSIFLSEGRVYVSNLPIRESTSRNSKLVKRAEDIQDILESQ